MTVSGRGKGTKTRTEMGMTESEVSRDTIVETRNVGNIVSTEPTCPWFYIIDSSIQK